MGVNTWKKKITENEGKMKDLKSKIKDLQKRGTQTKSALALKEKQDLNALQAKDTKKLAKEKVKEKGLVQKLEWDKRKVNKARWHRRKKPRLWLRHLVVMTSSKRKRRARHQS